jgi:tetratricopeptide (TPR) repeat protein
MSSRNPFLNWGRPTNLSAILKLSTGQCQNTSVNGFTGSADVFVTSVWHYFTMLWLDFTPIILPFILLGGWYLFKKQKRLFWLLFSIIITNFILSVLYLSGNQESWYLLSDVIFALFAGVGYLWLINKLKKQWITILLLLLALSPLIYWWNGLNRHNWKLTDEYINNLYAPIKEPAIFLGGSDLFVNYSYYNHDVHKYKPEVIPVLARLFYIYSPYQENLRSTTKIKIPDPTKYYSISINNFVSADGYSSFVNDFFALNIAHYRIYIDYPAYNEVYPDLSRPDGSPSFKLDRNRFKLIPAGLAYEVVPNDSNKQPDLQAFNYQFSNDFPTRPPTILERINAGELKNLINQYTLSYIAIGDYVMQEGKEGQSMSFYQKAYAMNPTNGAILSKLGIYCVQHNQPEEALRYFKQGAESYPNDPNWLYSMAVADGVMGNATDAITLLQQVIARTQNNPQLNAKANSVLNKIQQSTSK